MSRKFILGLAAVATLASTVILSAAASAAPHGHGGHGGHGAGGHAHVRPPLHRLPPRIVHRPHRHGHIVVRPIYERTYVRPVSYVRSVGIAAPVAESLCNCLTKSYTPEGVVVFKDLCTKEMASAPVEGVPAQASEVQSPNNFAGKTFQDFQAANGLNQSAEKKN